MVWNPQMLQRGSCEGLVKNGSVRQHAQTIEILHVSTANEAMSSKACQMLVSKISLLCLHFRYSTTTVHHCKLCFRQHSSRKQ